MRGACCLRALCSYPRTDVALDASSSSLCQWRPGCFFGLTVHRFGTFTRFRLRLLSIGESARASIAFRFAQAGDAERDREGGFRPCR